MEDANKQPTLTPQEQREERLRNLQKQKDAAPKNNDESKNADFSKSVSVGFNSEYLVEKPGELKNPMMA
jgi:hypothetical protein